MKEGVELTDTISIPTYTLEICSQVVNLTFYLKKRLPFNTWGEILVIGLQNAVILVLCLLYRHRNKKDEDKEEKNVPVMVTSFLCGVAAGCAVIWRNTDTKSAVKERILSLFPVLSTILYMSSRLPQVTIDFLLTSVLTLLLHLIYCCQVWSNYKHGSTGELSAVTWGLGALGGLIRVGTTLRQVKDMNVLLSYLAIMLLNCTVFMQILYYKNKHHKQ